MKFAIRHHEKAPLLKTENPQLLVEQAVGEMSSLQTTEPVRQLLRQIGFCNLWFFEKFIAGYNGPFDKLNADLHLDMANFYQEHATVPGCRIAAWEPRWHLKTTVFTTGGNAWDLVINPNDTILLYHSVVEQAYKFFDITRKIFLDNEFFAWLYPEYSLKNEEARHNSKEFTLPPSVKTRFTADPSLSCGSVGSSSQGKHPTKLSLDDIVGEDDLGAGYKSTVDMIKKRQWLEGAEEALISDPATVRIVLSCTRYGVDDAYAFIEKDMGKLIAYDEEKASDYDVVPGGRWTVYWRFAEENGEPIFPEKVSKKYLAYLRKNKPWFYWTQMENRPSKSGINEFQEYKVGECKLLHDENRGYLIKYENLILPLDQCDVVQAADPAATETDLNARLSRSAVVLLAHAPNDIRFVLGIKAGHVAPSKMFEWMFENRRMFKDYIRSSYLEAMGAFKVLLEPIRQLEIERNFFLNLKPCTVTGKKDVRIRSALEPLLHQGKLFVNEDCRSLFDEEYRSFPEGNKNDIMDALAQAAKSTTRPLSEEEIWEKEELDLRREEAISSSVAGYG